MLFDRSYIISTSLAIRIAEQSANEIDHVVSPMSAHRYCGKMADWIRMPFGVVSGVVLGMGVLDFGDDRRRGRDRLGVNLGRPIVTNENYAE